MVYNLRIFADLRVAPMPQPEPNEPQSLTDRAQKSLLDFVEGQIERGFQDFGSAASDLPAFLAGPQPATAAALPLWGISRAACRTWARGGGPQNLPGFDVAWGGLCTPYLDSIGEAPDDGNISRPFDGGQCSGVGYTIIFEQRTNSGSGFEWIGPIVRGGIGPLSVAKADPVGVSCGEGSPLFPNNAALFQGDGLRVVTLALGCTDDPNGYRILSIARDDGQPDDCGNPEAQYKPPTQAPNLPQIGPQPVGFPGIGPLDIDISFGPDGELVIGFPGFDGSLTLDNPFDPPVPPTGQGVPTTPGTAGDVANSGDGGVNEGTAPDGSELTGVLVRVVSAHLNANTVDRASAEIFRGVGYVAMGYPGLLGVDTSGAVVESPQFFHAQQRGLTSWRVRANVGFNLETTPYYRETES